MSTPCPAALVSALTTLTGVLMTSAQGQAMTSICKARISQLFSPQNGCPKKSGGTAATNAAISVTTGV